MLILEEEEEEEEEEVMPSRRSSRESVMARRSRKEAAAAVTADSALPSRTQTRKANGSAGRRAAPGIPITRVSNIIDLWTETACRLCDRRDFPAETDSLAEHYATAHFRPKLEAEAGGSRTASDFPCAACRAKRPRSAAFASRRQLSVHLGVVHGRAAALLAAKLNLKAGNSRPASAGEVAIGDTTKSGGKPAVQTKNSERSQRGGGSDSRTKGEESKSGGGDGSNSSSSPEVIELDDESSRNSDKDETASRSDAESPAAAAVVNEDVKVVKDTREEKNGGESEEEAGGDKTSEDELPVRS